MKQLLWVGIDGDYLCVANTYEEVVRYLVNKGYICENYLVYRTICDKTIAIKELFGANWANTLERIDYETFNKLFEDETESIIILPADYIS